MLLQFAECVDVAAEGFSSDAGLADTGDEAPAAEKPPPPPIAPKPVPPPKPVSISSCAASSPCTLVPTQTSRANISGFWLSCQFSWLINTVVEKERIAGITSCFVFSATAFR